MQDTSDAEILTAKGMGSGLVIRISREASWPKIYGAVIDYVKARRNFLAGQSVLIDWQGKTHDPEDVKNLVHELKEGYSISVRSAFKRLSAEANPEIDVETDLDLPNSLSLFDGVADFNQEVSAMENNEIEMPSSTNKLPIEDWDSPDCRIYYKTLRSGQRIESEHSVVLVGDVNSGAEIIAGGDIIVLGILRGVAHAGAFDETGGGRFIFAVELAPTQLRIGAVISRGTEAAGKQPEIARVDGNNIIVQPYSVKFAQNRFSSF